MDREIAEVQRLATKYSKSELGRMVQMGLLNPQKAMMAGMMIDRIQKQNAQPPQSTVAQDVLGLPGMQQRAQAAPQTVGLETLPAQNIGEYAGGGIVAFADGGDTDDYAEGGVARFKDQGYVKSEWQIPPSVQAQRDQERQRILMQELADARARVSRGDPRAQADVDSLTRELRRMVPKPSADAGGITSLIPSAQAAGASPYAETSSAFGRGVKKLLTPFPQSTYQSGLETYDKRLSEVNSRIGELGGTLGMRQQTPEEQAEFDQLMKDRQVLMSARNNLAQDISKYNAGTANKPAAATPPKTEVAEAPAADGKEAAPAKEAAPKTPEVARPKPIVAEQIAVPAERTLQEEARDIRGAYKELGVDVDMYKNQMKELEGKKASLSKRREAAFGTAMMSLGLGLMGAREGQVMQQLSSEGQKALGQYMNSMERIIDNEEKLDMLSRQLQMAENNFNRTGADSALAQVRARRERIEQVEAKNIELRQRAAEHTSTLEAQMYNTDVGALVRKEVAASMAEAKAAQASRAGALTKKQQFDIEQQLRIELEPKLRAQYKNIGSEAQINKKVESELRKQINARIADINARSSGYGGNPPSDMFQDWSVEGM